jgi:hypothetical protein
MIGFHKWKQNRKFHAADYSPSSSLHETPVRECTNCDKKQKWIIGKGNGEMGHWKKFEILKLLGLKMKIYSVIHTRHL